MLQPRLHDVRAEKFNVINLTLNFSQNLSLFLRFFRSRTPEESLSYFVNIHFIESR